VGLELLQVRDNLRATSVLRAISHGGGQFQQVLHVAAGQGGELGDDFFLSISLGRMGMSAVR